jgi:autophagy-related protein 101
MREYVAEQLSDNVLTICELVNKPQYLPKIPTRLEITSVYDTRFADCDPYLWRLESEYGREILKIILKGNR